MGINVQSNSAHNSMKLQLDGGKQSYGEVTCFATVTDGTKTVNIEYPLSNLSEGMHTLTYTVYDMLGNSASRTITFMVGQMHEPSGQVRGAKVRSPLLGCLYRGIHGEGLSQR